MDPTNLADEQPSAGAPDAPLPDEAAPTADPAPGPADPLAEAQRERDDFRDRWMRGAAEFENYRRRVERDRREAGERATASAIEDLLPILDNFDHALAAPAGGDDTSGFRQGVELIHRQLVDLLGRRGVTPIDPLGSDFDPHLHQAVAHEESPGHRDGEVIAVMRRGYRMGDRLLRPAVVKVAKA